MGTRTAAVSRSGALASYIVDAWAAPSARAFSVASTGALSDAAGAPAGAVTRDDVIVEVTGENFAQVVMTSDVPVILDCYADWCGPCKQLTPILEDAVLKANGRLKLAKLNTDNNAQLSQGLNVTKLPTVIGVHQGKMVGSFTGMVAQPDLDAFLDKLLAMADVPVQETSERQYLQGQAAMDIADEGGEDALEARAQAKGFFTRALELANLGDDATEAEKMVAAATYAGLVRIAVAEGDLDTANQLAGAIRNAYPSSLNVPEVSRALSVLELAGTTPDTSDVAVLRAAVEADGDDLESRFELAQTLLAAGGHKEAIDQCLEIVKRDASWNEDAGRTTLLKIFEALGSSHELTVAGRRRLASLLFR